MPIESFVDTIVAKVVETIQISDPSVAAGIDDDPMVRTLVGVAYSHICSYCNRRFMQDTFTEEYHGVKSRLKLRHTPVIQVSNVWIDDVELVLGTDYTVVGDRINILLPPPFRRTVDLYDPLIGSNFDSMSLPNTSYPRDRDVLVKYVGGHEMAEEHYDLYNSLLLQSMAWYNRRSTLGVARVAVRQNNSDIDAASDLGDLLESVKTIMSPYVNYSDVDYA